MADDVPIVKISRQYPRRFLQRAARPTPAPPSPLRKLLAYLCVIASTGGTYFALSVLWNDDPWHQALLFAAAFCLPALLITMLRGPHRWRRVTTPNAPESD